MPDKVTQQVPVKRHGYGASFLHAAIQKRVATESTNRDPRQELHEYLAAPLDDFTEDVIRWWGVSNSFLFCNTHY